MDLNRIFPGRPDGTTTERIAYTIWEIALKADALIDFHGNPDPGLIVAISRPKATTNSDTVEMSDKMLEAYGVTKIHSRDGPSPKTKLSVAATMKGIPTITVELTGSRRMLPKPVEVGTRGVLNVMKQLGMIDGEIEPQSCFALEGWYETGGIITANRGGLVHFEKKPGEFIPKGSVIARIVDVYGDEVEAVQMPFDGYIYGMPASFHGFQTLYTGGCVAIMFKKE
jgi:predicted deacylase